LVLALLETVSNAMDFFSKARLLCRRSWFSD
jgi:hypothetical protein